MQLVENAYEVTKLFPSDERFGLTSQIRRSAVSVPANIAEGACRRTTNAFVNHVSIALGSHAEFETCVEIAFRLGYLTGQKKVDLLSVSNSTGRLLNGLLHALEAKQPRR